MQCVLLGEFNLIGSPQPQINVKISLNKIDFLMNSPSNKTFCITLNTVLKIEHDVRHYMERRQLNQFGDEGTGWMYRVLFPEGKVFFSSQY
jgi:hypothetical protein